VTEEEQAILRQTLIKESIGLLAVLAVVWYMGPGRILIGGIRRRAEIYMEGRRSDIDIEVAQFGNQVSRWDHEQAAKADRRPGGERPCGCG
jgi:hypothetical protein